MSVPGSLREAHEHGGFYLFSIRFFEDLPKRLAGPGKLRFLFQPAMAIFLGWQAGRSDARAGRPPFLHGVFLRAENRAAVIRETWEGIAVLFLSSILCDSVFQWLLLGVSYPGAALVVGPVLNGKFLVDPTKFDNLPEDLFGLNAPTLANRAYEEPDVEKIV